MYAHKSGHFLVGMSKDMKRDNLEDELAVRHVVVQAESKQGLMDRMVEDLVI